MAHSFKVKKQCPICHRNMVSYDKGPCFDCLQKRHRELVREARTQQRQQQRQPERLNLLILAPLVLLILVITPMEVQASNNKHQSNSDLLKQIIQHQKLQIQLQQDNFGLLLNATHNTTAQLQISNIYLQNAMVESHNQQARLLQALGK